MQWKKTVGAAAVLGALLSTPLMAQINVMPAVISISVMSDTVAPAPSWAAERAQMMRAVNRDVHSLEFNGTHLRRSVRRATFDLTPASVMLLSLPIQIQGAVFSFERPKAHCSGRARTPES